MSATVRTFRASDSTAALAAVKAALGPDAILISTRTVQGGIFRRPEVEVTAAAGDAMERSPSPWKGEGRGEGPDHHSRSSRHGYPVFEYPRISQ